MRACLLLVAVIGEVYGQLLTDKTVVMANKSIATAMLSTQSNQFITVRTEGYNELDSVSSTNSSSQDSLNTLKPTRTPSRTSIIDMGSLPRQVYEDFKHIYKYLQFVAVSFAIITNSCNIIVFTQSRMRSATFKILYFLSFAELVVAVVEMTVNSYATFLQDNTYVSELYWQFFKWGRLYLTSIFEKSSICFNLIVATQRFIAVRFPLKAHHILGRTSPLVICSSVIVIMFLSHIYSPLKVTVVAFSRGNSTFYMFGHSELFHQNQEVFEGIGLAVKITFTYIPLFGCLVMNLMMVFALRQHRIQRKGMNLRKDIELITEKREIRTSTTILISSFVFVLFALPVTVSSIVRTTNPDYGFFKQEHYLYAFVVSFSGMLSMVGLSMDFFVYMIFNQEFRQTFIWLLRRGYRKMVSCCDHVPDGGRRGMEFCPPSEGTVSCVFSTVDGSIQDRNSEETTGSIV